MKMLRIDERKKKKKSFVQNQIVDRTEKKYIA